MEIEISRTGYFNGQFLQEAEFTNEQTYHLHMRRRWAYALFDQSGVVQSTPSDLAVAVELTMTDEDEALGVWISEKRKWQAELGALLPWTIDMELYHSEATPHVIKYVAEGGQEIYRTEATESI